jgi:hypothetical protein
MTRNQYGAWVSSPGVEASFQRCEVSVNADAGLRVANGATLRVSESAIAGNAIGLENFVSGSLATLERFGNNAIRGNTTNLSGTIVAVPLQ